MDSESATATPRSKVAVTVKARDLQIIQDKPEEYGGQNEGMMASELLMASLLGCQNSTAVKVAAKRKVEMEIKQLAAEMEFDAAGDIGEIRVHFTFTGIDEKQAATIVKLTDKTCTISRALSCPVVTSFTIE